MTCICIDLGRKSHKTKLADLNLFPCSLGKKLTEQTEATISCIKIHGCILEYYIQIFEFVSLVYLENTVLTDS